MKRREEEEGEMSMCKGCRGVKWAASFPSLRLKRPHEHNYNCSKVCGNPTVTEQKMKVLKMSCCEVQEGEREGPTLPESQPGEKGSSVPNQGGLLGRRARADGACSNVFFF